MKVVVTGGAGFIGSNIVDMLVEEGHDVVVVDDLSTGKRENVNEKATLFEIDIADRETETTINILASIFSGADTVYHVAALPRVEPSIVNPTESHKINVNGTYNVFWAAKKANVKNVVFSSSSSVYGDAVTPTKETANLNPMSPYALQKLVNEQYGKLFCDLYEMNITCLRYFNVYGHREPTEGSYVPVIGIWLRQFKDGNSLTITGDGEQSRDFVNVYDVAKANLAVRKANLQGFNVFNVGSGRTHKLNYLASLISDDTTYITPRIEPKYTLADIKNLKNATGWQPEVSLIAYLEAEVKGNAK
jgi:UDP-glucose 4-epimerase